MTAGALVAAVTVAAGVALSVPNRPQAVSTSAELRSPGGAAGASAARPRDGMGLPTPWLPGGAGSRLDGGPVDPNGPAGAASATESPATSVPAPDPSYVMVAPASDPPALPAPESAAAETGSSPAAEPHRAEVVREAPPVSRYRDELSGNRAIGYQLLTERGWSVTQWVCLNKLWTKESGWQVHNRNPESGSYGIPQALPAIKMATMGSDWRDNPATQIKWGLAYIADRYGTPCAAWAHSERYNFY